MRESHIENALGTHVKAAGARALKFTTPGFVGVPDRIILAPGGRAIFVEVKAPGQQPRPIQMKRIEELRDLGFTVLVIDSLNQIQEVIDEIHRA